MKHWTTAALAMQGSRSLSIGSPLHYPKRLCELHHFAQVADLHFAHEDGHLGVLLATNDVLKHLVGGLHDAFWIAIKAVLNMALAVFDGGGEVAAPLAGDAKMETSLGSRYDFRVELLRQSPNEFSCCHLEFCI